MKKEWKEENDSIENGERSCLNCALYNKCTNKSKSFSYICLKHKPKIILDLDDFEKQVEEETSFSFDPTKEDEFDIKEYIDKVVNSDASLHIDAKIDTSDIPQAPNFYTFCFDPRYLNIKPYPKQLEVMCEYYNEVCWHCSNKEWKHNFPYRAKLDDIKENITFMEFGVCPKCGRKKSKRINKGIEQQYKQFVGLIGQRCVIGSTKLQLSHNKYITFEELFKLHSIVEGFQEYKGPDILVYTGLDFKQVTPSKFYYSKNQDVYEIKINKRYTCFQDETIEYSTSITGTLEHPVLCAYLDGTTGWVKIKDLLDYRYGIKGIVSIDFDLDAIKHTQIISICPIEDITYKGKQDVFDIEVPEYHSFIANNLINHNSGKSYISVAASAYFTHWALKQKSLPLLFGLAPHSQLHSIFVAMTYKQIKDSVYDSLYSLYTNAPWFVSMHECLDYYGRKYGEPLYAVKDTFYRYRTCNLTGFISTPDYRTLRGKTSVGVSVFDEVGLMSSSSENSIKNNVDQVHKSILNSYRTTNSAIERLYEEGNNNVLNNSFMNISSPYSKNDKIMRLYNQSRTIKSMYGVRYKSFEFNPDFDYKSFEDERQANYSDYLRDIECIPPTSSNPYIDNINHIATCLGNQTNAIKITSKQFETKTGKNMSTGELKYNWTDKSVQKILALDAGRCVVGDTLISTDSGLFTIRELCPKKCKNNPINVKLNSLDKEVSSKYIHYMGKKPVKEVITYTNNSIIGTNNHPQLVLRNGELVWVKIEDLNVGDFLCFKTNCKNKVKKLKLNIKPLKYTSGSSRKVKDKGIYWNKYFNMWEVQYRLNEKQNFLGRFKTKKEAIFERNKVFDKYKISYDLQTKRSHIKYPKYMTTDLAYFLGMLVSEGCFSKYNVSISNYNKNILDKCTKILKLFGIKCCKYDTKLSFSSSEFCDMLKQLGLKNERVKKNIRQSRYKEVPSTILKADTQSQFAYLAGFIDGDGSVCIGDTSRIYLYSSSIKMLKQLQVLLNYLGIMTRIEGQPISIDYVSNKKKCSAFKLVTHSICDFEKLYSGIKPYLKHENKKGKYVKSSRPSKNNRIPTSYFYDFIMSRKIKSDVNGTVFKKDDGSLITIKKFYDIFMPYVGIQYDALYLGKYNDFEKLLKSISVTTYNKYKKLIKLNYRYSEVVKILDKGIQPVYDITVKENETPAYVANGMLIHNTNNSFALSLAHLSEDNIPIYDTLVELIPVKGCPINFTRMTKSVIYKIIEDFGVKMVVADRWNSAKLLDDIEETYGIKVENYSVKYSDFSSFKEAILNEQIKFPKCETPLDKIETDVENYPYCMENKPITHFAFQIVTVQDDGSKSVDKGDGYTDDLLRSAVLAYSYLTDNDYKSEFKGTPNKNRTGGLASLPGKGGVVNSNIGARPTGSANNSGLGAVPR